MTRVEYAKKQTAVSRYARAVETKQRQLIRAALRAALARVKARVMAGGNGADARAAFDADTQAKAQTAIIDEWAGKPAEKLEGVGAAYKADLLRAAGVDAPTETRQNAAGNPLAKYNFDGAQVYNWVMGIRRREYTRASLTPILTAQGVSAPDVEAFFAWARGLTAALAEALRGKLTPVKALAGKEWLAALTRPAKLPAQPAQTIPPAQGPRAKATPAVKVIRGKLFTYAQGEPTAPGNATNPVQWQEVSYDASFYRKYNLSDRVWAAVKEQEDVIYATVEGGRALGRDAKDIAGDLDGLLRHDGGKYVAGRWMNMVPAKKLEAETDAVLDANGWDSWDPARRAEARKEALSNLHKQGWQLKDQPQEVQDYYNRLGSAGIDYRSERIIRTQTQFTLNEEARAQGQDPDISTGRVEWVLDAKERRAHLKYQCDCVKFAKISAERGGYLASELPVPPHPNCACSFRPVVKDVKTALADIKKRYGLNG